MSGILALHTVLQTSVTVSTLPIALPPELFGEQILRAVLTVETDSIRIKTDGGNPSSGDGHLVRVGQRIVIEGPKDIGNFRMVRATTDATVTIGLEAQ